MKSISLLKKIQTGQLLKRIYISGAVASSVFYSGLASAQLKSIDLSQSKSSSNFSNVAENLGGAADSAISLALLVFSLIGVIVAGMSIYTLYKAGKDEREKPTGAIVGLFVGGLMIGIPAIMWIFRNTVVSV